MPSPRIPSDGRLEGTWALLRDPYRFISGTCRRLGSDIFTTRLLLSPTICMTGADGADFFYSSKSLTRAQAAPLRIRRTLLGDGGVQGLDEADHRHRKAMFLSLMETHRVRRLGELVCQQWLEAARGWRGTIDLYSELQRILMRAVCAWSGIPLRPEDVTSRTHDLAALFDAAGAIGPRHWLARRARLRSETWAMGLIADARAHRLRPAEESALRVIADHRDRRGRMLDLPVAGVELLNVIRPTVAMAVFMVQSAHALAVNPDVHERLRQRPEEYAPLIGQEVRRFYPFFPAAIARTKEAVTWRSYELPAGHRVLLDLHGINHDPRKWSDPGLFLPERFRGSYDAAAFVPQGGGAHADNHRCPGEWIAVELLRITALLLSGPLSYRVPPQPLEIPMRRIPALPARFTIDEVRVNDDHPAMPRWTTTRRINRATVLR